ncbi:hypothetical protein VTK73DRAFT_6463 [Phialemonium thermophilum]|uniref:Uncharacterized protein n=1 Tax=Phialemonium thermophilum TaxID=223376 RepID=A0ABR3V043_9PEZI
MQKLPFVFRSVSYIRNPTLAPKIPCQELRSHSFLTRISSKKPLASFFLTFLQLLGLSHNEGHSRRSRVRRHRRHRPDLVGLRSRLHRRGLPEHRERQAQRLRGQRLQLQVQCLR